MHNRNFGKISADNHIAYAPATIADERGVIANPNLAQYRARGYYLIVSEPPTGKVGVEYVPTEYGDIVDGRIVRRYDERPIVAPPRHIRHFSKLSLYVVLTRLGITDESFMAWLATKEVEVDGVTIRGDIAFNKAQDLTDNHPAFESIVKDAQTQFGITDEQLAEILAAIEYNPFADGEVA